MFYITLLFVLILFYSCGTEPDNEHVINPNIVLIKDCCEIGEKYGGNYYLSTFLNNQITTTAPLTTFVLDNDFNIIETINVWKNIVEKFEDPFGTGFYFNQIEQDQILFIKSEFGNVSLGSLYEYNIFDNELVLIRDASFKISTAVYFHNDDSKLVYYSYGDDDGLQAGYYLYDKTTDTDSLILAHRSEIGPSEILNGFDLSPDGTKLLYPDIRASFTNPDIPQTPQIIEYNLHTLQADTFATEFDLSFVRVGLWLRYSPSGDRILYANYPLGSLGVTTNDDSEVGIIELPSRRKRILDVNTNPDGEQRSVQLAPTWTPDGQNIIYGSGSLFYPSGAKGTYSLYLLKNLDDPLNYK